MYSLIIEMRKKPPAPERKGSFRFYTESVQLNCMVSVRIFLRKRMRQEEFRVPTASHKSYNLTRCPIFVLYLGEEGICPIFSLKMSYKSYNLHVLSYNHFQIHVQPTYRQVQAKFFAAVRQIHTLYQNILYSSTSLDVFGCWNFRRCAAISDSSIVHTRIQLFEQKKTIPVF